MLRLLFSSILLNFIDCKILFFVWTCYIYTFLHAWSVKCNCRTNRRVQLENLVEYMIGLNGSPKAATQLVTWVTLVWKNNSEDGKLPSCKSAIASHFYHGLRQCLCLAFFSFHLVCSAMGVHHLYSLHRQDSTCSPVCHMHSHACRNLTAKTTQLKWPWVQVTAVSGSIEQVGSVIKEIPKHNQLQRASRKLLCYWTSVCMHPSAGNFPVLNWRIASRWLHMNWCLLAVCASSLKLDGFKMRLMDDNYV